MVNIANYLINHSYLVPFITVLNPLIFIILVEIFSIQEFKYIYIKGFRENTKIILPLIFVLILFISINILLNQIDSLFDYNSLFAPIIAIITSIIAAIVFIDTYNAFKKQKQWNNFRIVTFQNLNESLINILSSLSWLKAEPQNINDNIQIACHSEVRIRDTQTGIESLPDKHFEILSSDLINSLNSKLNGNNQSFENHWLYTKIAQINKALQYDINQIRTILIPRILTFSDDQKLIDAIVELDTSILKFEKESKTYFASIKDQQIQAKQSVFHIPIGNVRPQTIKIIIRLIENLVKVENLIKL